MNFFHGKHVLKYGNSRIVFKNGVLKLLKQNVNTILL